MDNPFIVDRPVPSEELIDREAEWRGLVERAHAGTNTRLTAPRRYGKTTLLRKALRECEREGFRPIYIDFFGVLSIEEMLVRIEEAYARALKGAIARWFAGVRRTWRPAVRAGTEEISIEISGMADDDAPRALHEALDLPLKAFERDGIRAVVVFDEFQEVLTAEDRIDGLIRSHIQHHGDAATYVFAGSHPGMMAELFGLRERPLYGQARALQLHPLADVDLAEYIGNRFERTGKNIGAALSPLLEVVRGHPQRAMLAAHHVWALTEPGAAADEATWEAALEAILDETQEGFERSWDELSTNERRVMAAVAWTGPWGQGESLFASSTLSRFKLSKGTARDVREKLLRRGDLESAAEKRVRLVDPVFELWIASGRRQR